MNPVNDQPASPLTNPPDGESVVLEARNITKRFPGVIANDQVNFELRRGEILALLGENGAGKSTLMNIIYGLYHQDEGEVLLKGKEVRFTNPREAIHSGIGMVHQHFQLVDVMTVAENVVLGEERETPSTRNLFITLLFIGLVGLLGYQLATGTNILFDLINNFIPNILSRELGGSSDNYRLFSNLEDSQLVAAQPLIYETFTYLLVGAVIPFLGASIGQLLIPPLKGRATNVVASLLFFVAALLLSVGQLGDRTELLSVAAVLAGGAGLAAAGASAIIYWRRSRQNGTASADQPLPDEATTSEDDTPEIRMALQLTPWWAGFFSILLPLYLVNFLILNTSAIQTIDFLLPLFLTGGLVAILARILAVGLNFMFEHWAAVTSGSRIVWGLAWRAGLIWAAVWLAGLALRTSQMGVMAYILKQDPTHTSHVDISDAGALADNPQVKGGVTYDAELSISWNRIGRAGTTFESQINALKAAVTDSFRTTEEQQLTTDAYTMQAEVTRWNGLDPRLLDTVDTLPLQVGDLTFGGLSLIFLALGLWTWRGAKELPGLLTPLDIVLMLGLGGVYVWRLMEYPQHLSTPIHVTLIGLGVAVTLGITAAVYFYRQRKQDELLPITALDSAIEAAASATYSVASFRDTEQAARRVRELSRQYGLEVDPHAIIEKLPVGLQQRVEIIKALYRQADILILDEPTAALTPQEGQELFRIMRELAAQGVSIIFITHKLKEVFQVASRIIVMRGGKVVGTAIPEEATEASLAAMMVGREVLFQVEKDEAQPAGAVLSVNDLHARNERGAVVLNGVSFEVQAGEVLGIAGVQGNGQSELVEALAGLRQLDSGSIEIQGQELRPDAPPPANLLKRGAAAVLDAALVGILAVMVSYLIFYFRREQDAFSITATTTLLTFLALDVLLTLPLWWLKSSTFGKAVMGIELKIISSQPASAPSPKVRQRTGFVARLLLYSVRYVLQSLMRYSLIGAVVTYFEAKDDPQHRAWYDRLAGWSNSTVVEKLTVSPRRIKNMQAAHVPEDRLRFGMVKQFTVAENLVLNDYYEWPYAEAPNMVQLFPLTAVYSVIFGGIFLGIASLWANLWTGTLWNRLLDWYKVPSQIRTVPIERALTSTERLYLNDPLLVALVALLGGAVIFGLISHLVAGRLTELLRRQLLNGRLAQAVGYNVTATQDSVTPPSNPVMSMLLAREGLNLNLKQAVTHAGQLIERYDIRTPSPLVEGGSLSGGNQQKMVVAREFNRHPRLLIAAQPTRGIDVGSIEFIHQQIVAQRDQGAAVLLVSAELDEIMSLSDRIAVMYRGQIVEVVDAKTATRERLGLLMAGIRT